jgi:hypothetical protein
VWIPVVIAASVAWFNLCDYRLAKSTYINSMFMKILLLLVFSTCLNVASAQINLKSEINIQGEIIEKTMANDSIYFNSGVINSKYFEKPLFSAKIVDNKFSVKNELLYPQMFRIVFLSDKNKRIWRFGRYFIEPSTKFMKINYLSEECNSVDGQTENEYLNKFIPFFFINKVYDCKSNDMLNFDQSIALKFDTILFNYVVKNPNSYVALWSLIERYSLFGQTEIRQKTLEHFSKELKNGKIWNLLSDDIRNSKIKENKKFPIIDLKTYDLKKTKLDLPKAKFILIDYWFSRCRPCLDDLPALKKIYSLYKSKGFEIVSISTDKTKDVLIWQKRVKENELNWLQYLDENGIEASKLSVDSFPTAFLLNGRGEMIKKYLSTDDLGSFLKAHLTEN